MNKGDASAQTLVLFKATFPICVMRHGPHKPTFECVTMCNLASLSVWTSLNSTGEIMNLQLRLASLAIASAAVMALTACGGGSDAAAPAPAPAPAATTPVPVTVVDGAIRNATVCLDKNKNGLCDTGEPSGKTDVSGNVTLQVDPADAGKYPILAVVGTDAVDADTGPITIAYTMQAPADKPAVVSPLTTMVQTVIATTGVSSADAETSVKAQTGLDVSLFQDFTKSTTPESQAAGTVARMVVVVTQQQSEIVKSSVGSSAIDGAPITKADLDEAIQRKLLELLPSLLAALADPSVQNATTPAAKEAALLAQATTIVSSSGLNTTSVATVVAINNQAPSASTADSPTLTMSLATLNYFDPLNWFVRTFTGSVAQNTVVAGLTHNVERRARVQQGGPVQRWNNGQDPSRQSDVHFNGTAWVVCGLNKEGSSTVRDAAGNSDYDYCDKREVGKQARSVFDVTGRTMLSVYEQIRAAGHTNLNIPMASTYLGTATFPANSRLLYQTNTPVSTAFTYLTGHSNFVQVSTEAIAAGRTSATDTAAACAGVLTTTPSTSYQTATSSLETMVARYPGTPCVNGTITQVVNTSSGGTATVSSNGSSNNWGFTSLNVGIIGTVTTGNGFGVYPTSYYTTNTLARVAFGPGNVAKYYSCLQRWTDGSPRNCTQVGTGTYTITPIADARVMTFSGQPALFNALTYERAFVERGGRVHFGYKNRPATFPSARLNLAAGNALLTQLNLAPVDPDSTLALTAGSYAGDWRISDAGAEAAKYTTIRINNNGSTACLYNNADGTSGTSPTCNVNFTNVATGAVTLTLGDGVLSGNFDFLTGVATGTFTPTVGTPVTGSGLRR
jgi:hypothetical protein